MPRRNIRSILIALTVLAIGVVPVSGLAQTARGCGQ
jgi:hypothetical protein